jgi:hypothetical protein
MLATTTRERDPMDRLQAYEPVGNDPLGAFEIRLEDEHKATMRREMAEEVARKDAKATALHSRRCPRCEGALHGHGKTGVTSFLALCGEVRVRLRRLRRISCGHIVVPGAALIPTGNVTATLAERMCDLASKMSYGKGAESMGIQHKIDMSPKRFWAAVQTEATLINDTLADEAKALFEHGTAPECIDLKGLKPLIIGLDGGWVRGWRAKVGFEVKCATVATGSAPGPGRHRHLKDRAGYAAQCSAEEFRKRVSVLALKSGYATASACIFVSDGASWISKMVSDWFPDAIHVLDFYHLKHKVKGLFGLRAEGLDADFRDAAVSACDRFDPDLISGIVKLWASQQDAAKAKAAADLIGYVEGNAQAIRNHRLVDIHGSGWIEKGVDLMVSRRMKMRGMAWTETGSPHMIPFAVMRYNKQWDVYWNQRKGLSQTTAA